MESVDRKERPALNAASNSAPASADRLGTCTRLALAALGLPLLATVLLAFFLGFTNPAGGPASRYLGELNLDRPAWFPSGRLERHPMMYHPGVPVRFSPRLPADAADIGRMLLEDGADEDKYP